MKKKSKAKQSAEQPTPEMLLSQDAKAMMNQLSNGVPLKAYQRRQLQSMLADGGGYGGGDPNFAQSFNALADALGVSRQVISYHNRKPDCPQPRQDGRHDVAAWKRYLTMVGRLDVGASQDRPSRDSGKSQVQIRMENAVISSFWCWSEALPVAVEAALLDAEIKATNLERDKLCFALWYLLAIVVHRNLTSEGLDGVFSGEMEFPDAIRKVAVRLEMVAGGDDKTTKP